MDPTPSSSPSPSETPRRKGQPPPAKPLTRKQRRRLAKQRRAAGKKGVAARQKGAPGAAAPGAAAQGATAPGAGAAPPRPAPGGGKAAPPPKAGGAEAPPKAGGEPTKPGAQDSKSPGAAGIAQGAAGIGGGAPAIGQTGHSTRIATTTTGAPGAAAPPAAPAAPAAGPTPAGKPAPAAPSAHPAQPAKPGAAPAKPAAQVAKPAEPAAKPQAQAAKPAAQVAKPAEPAAKPQAQAAKPAEVRSAQPARPGPQSPGKAGAQESKSPAAGIAQGAAGVGGGIPAVAGTDHGTRIRTFPGQPAPAAPGAATPPSPAAPSATPAAPGAPPSATPKPVAPSAPAHAAPKPAAPGAPADAVPKPAGAKPAAPKPPAKGPGATGMKAERQARSIEGKHRLRAKGPGRPHAASGAPARPVQPAPLQPPAQPVSTHPSQATAPAGQAVKPLAPAPSRPPSAGPGSAGLGALGEGRRISKRRRIATFKRRPMVPMQPPDETGLSVAPPAGTDPTKVQPPRQVPGPGSAGLTAEQRASRIIRRHDVQPVSTRPPGQPVAAPGQPTHEIGRPVQGERLPGGKGPRPSRPGSVGLAAERRAKRLQRRRALLRRRPLRVRPAGTSGIQGDHDTMPTTGTVRPAQPVGVPGGAHPERPRHEGGTVGQVAERRAKRLLRRRALLRRRRRPVVRPAGTSGIAGEPAGLPTSGAIRPFQAPILPGGVHPAGPRHEGPGGAGRTAERRAKRLLRRRALLKRRRRPVVRPAGASGLMGEPGGLPTSGAIRPFQGIVLPLGMQPERPRHEGPGSLGKSMERRARLLRRRRALLRRRPMLRPPGTHSVLDQPMGPLPGGAIHPAQGILLPFGSAPERPRHEGPGSAGPRAERRARRLRRRRALLRRRGHVRPADASAHAAEPADRKGLTPTPPAPGLRPVGLPGHSLSLAELGELKGLLARVRPAQGRRPLAPAERRRLRALLARHRRARLLRRQRVEARRRQVAELIIRHRRFLNRRHGALVFEVPLRGRHEAAPMDPAALAADLRDPAMDTHLLSPAERERMRRIIHARDVAAQKQRVARDARRKTLFELLCTDAARRRRFRLLARLRRRSPGLIEPRPRPVRPVRPGDPEKPADDVAALAAIEHPAVRYHELTPGQRARICALAERKRRERERKRRLAAGRRRRLIQRLFGRRRAPLRPVVRPRHEREADAARTRDALGIDASGAPGDRAVAGAIEDPAVGFHDLNPAQRAHLRAMAGPRRGREDAAPGIGPAVLPEGPGPHESAVPPTVAVDRELRRRHRRRLRGLERWRFRYARPRQKPADPLGTVRPLVPRRPRRRRIPLLEPLRPARPPKRPSARTPPAVAAPAAPAARRPSGSHPVSDLARMEERGLRHRIRWLRAAKGDWLARHRSLIELAWRQFASLRPARLRPDFEALEVGFAHPLLQHHYLSTAQVSFLKFLRERRERFAASAERRTQDRRIARFRRLERARRHGGLVHFLRDEERRRRRRRLLRSLARRQSGLGEVVTRDDLGRIEDQVSGRDTPEHQLTREERASLARHRFGRGQFVRNLKRRLGRRRLHLPPGLLGMIQALPIPLPPMEVMRLGRDLESARGTLGQRQRKTTPWYQRQHGGRLFQLKAMLRHSRGRPIEPRARDFLERYYGRDLTHVSLHADRFAGMAAAKLRARAFQAGEGIYFQAGQLDERRAEGMGLLGHEVAHVLQQRTHGLRIRSQWEREARRHEATVSRLWEETALGGVRVGSFTHHVLFPSGFGRTRAEEARVQKIVARAKRECTKALEQVSADYRITLPKVELEAELPIHADTPERVAVLVGQQMARDILKHAGRPQLEIPIGRERPVVIQKQEAGERERSAPELPPPTAPPPGLFPDAPQQKREAEAKKDVVAGGFKIAFNKPLFEPRRLGGNRFVEVKGTIEVGFEGSFVPEEADKVQITPGWDDGLKVEVAGKISENEGAKSFEVKEIGWKVSPTFLSKDDDDNFVAGSLAGEVEVVLANGVFCKGTITVVSLKRVDGEWKFDLPNIAASGGKKFTFSARTEAPKGIVSGEASISGKLSLEPNKAGIAQWVAERAGQKVAETAAETAVETGATAGGAEAIIAAAIPLSFVVGGVLTLAAATKSLLEYKEDQAYASAANRNADGYCAGVMSGLGLGGGGGGTGDAFSNGAAEGARRLGTMMGKLRENPAFKGASDEEVRAELVRYLSGRRDEISGQVYGTFGPGIRRYAYAQWRSNVLGTFNSGFGQRDRYMRSHLGIGLFDKEFPPAGESDPDKISDFYTKKQEKESEEEAKAADKVKTSHDDEWGPGGWRAKANEELAQKRSEKTSVTQQQEGAISAARNRAAQAAGKCNGLKAQGKPIKPDAERKYGEGFSKFALGGQEYNQFKMIAYSELSEPRAIPIAAQKVIALYGAAEALFKEGNALQG